MFFTPRSRMLACTAAPSATTSSGLSSVCGFRPKYSWTVARISGVRVVPPTSTTSSISDGERVRVGKGLLHRAHRAIDDGTNQRVELSASEFVSENCAVGQRKPQRGGFGFGQLMLCGDQRLAQLLR